MPDSVIFVNPIQLEQGLTLPQFMELYGTEKKCEAALEQVRQPGGLSALMRGESMARFMADAISGINVDSVDIKRPSPQEQ